MARMIELIPPVVSIVGMIGFGLVMFWVFTAIFGAMDFIVTHDPLGQVSGMKNKVPGTPTPEGSEIFPYYLLGGDNLARDVYVVIGDPQVNGGWAIRTYIKPLTNWIWIGCGLMALGGFLSLSDRRFRMAAGARKTKPSPVPAE